MPFPKGRDHWWHSIDGSIYRAAKPRRKTDKPGRGKWWHTADGRKYVSAKPKKKTDKAGKIDIELHIARNQYLNQKKYSLRRGIPFLLTFEQWWEIWQKSGHWHERGILPHQYCMGRGTNEHPDVGEYKVGNIRVITNAQNRSEQDTSYLLGNTHALGSKHTKEWKAEASRRNTNNFHHAKLTVDDVRQIKKLLRMRVSLDSIAIKFNVAWATVHDIRIGRSWKWV
jgi:hypothetical protein